MATTMATDWIALLIAFVGGSLMTALISAFVKHCIFHPVISVRLDEKSGSYGTTVVYPYVQVSGPAWGAPEVEPGGHQARYLRLYVENTGLSSIKDCSGNIIKITPRCMGCAESRRGHLTLSQPFGCLTDRLPGQQDADHAGDGGYASVACPDVPADDTDDAGGDAEDYGRGSSVHGQPSASIELSE